MPKWQQFLLFLWEVAKQLREEPGVGRAGFPLYAPDSLDRVRSALFFGERPGTFQSEKGTHTAGTGDRFAHIESETQNQYMLGQ